MQTPVSCTKAPLPVLSTAILGLMFATGCNGPSLTSEVLESHGSLVAQGVVYSLPRSWLKITYPTDKAPASVEVVQMPDLRSSYVLTGKHSPWANDKSVFEVSNGLLQSVNSTPESRVASIVQTAVTAVSNGKKLLDNVPSGDDDEPAVLMVDPFNPPSGSGLTIVDETHPNGDGGSYDTARRSCNLPQDGKGKADGEDSQRQKQGFICVPVMTVVRVTLLTENKKYEFRASVADPVRTVTIPVNRSACTKAETAITLGNGVLTKFDATRPSEVEGCLSIPLNVVKAIIAAPFDAVTGRTARLEAEKKLADTQLALIQAQAKLLAAQQGNTAQ